MDLSLSRYIDTLRILEGELDTCYQEAKLSAPISRQIVRMAEEIRALQLYRERQPGARLELCGYLAKWAPELDLGKTLVSVFPCSFPWLQMHDRGGIEVGGWIRVESMGRTVLTARCGCSRGDPFRRVVLKNQRTIAKLASGLDHWARGYPNAEEQGNRKFGQPC